MQGILYVSYMSLKFQTGSDASDKACLSPSTTLLKLIPHKEVRFIFEFVYFNWGSTVLIFLYYSLQTICFVDYRVALWLKKNQRLLTLILELIILLALRVPSCQDHLHQPGKGNGLRTMKTLLANA